MHSIYRLKASELDQNILEGIKAIYGDKEIEIVVSEFDETDYLLKSEANRNRLQKAIESVEKGEKLIKVSLEEL